MAYEKFGMFALRTPASNGFAIGLAFTTNGSGVPTLVDDYDGKVTIGVATNTYTITIAPVGRWYSANVSHSLEATVNKVVTKDADAGTIVIAFSGSFFSASCDVFAFASDSLNG